jgi:putative nucleotidyltransferase with HDIG domain
MLISVPGSRELNKNEMRLLNTLAEITGNALHRMKLHEETAHRAEEFASLYETNTAITTEHDLASLLQTIVYRATTLLHATGGGMYLHNPSSGELEVVVATHPSIRVGTRLEIGEGIAGRVAQSRQPLRIDDYAAWEGRSPKFDQASVRAVLEVPILFGGELIGVLVAEEIGDSERKFTEADERLLSLFAAQAAGVIRSARLREETEQRLQNLQALREVDRVVTSSFDLRPILNAVVSHTVSQLGVDAADVLLLNSPVQTLEYAAGAGFHTRGIERSNTRLGQGHAGNAAFSRRTVHIPNLPETGSTFRRATLLAGENFMEYFGVPLISKGEVKGVLEIFHRSQLRPNREWLELLETMAGQAAIAIDNSQLFEKIQHSNLELALAYDATIEGWSRAMDLRDQETEGHTQRVTEKTVLLARSLGLPDEDILHIRRGALLHDIGKIGVPDNILLKDGPLTEKEWDIMRKHPQYAYEMLHPINYLRPSMEIPHLHHEKWDGTGYPLGLKGEQIPLAARIFAIVDVYDALTSDRPYRKAWSEEKALNYIREQSGRHFDPELVEKFIQLLQMGRLDLP